MTEMNIKKEIGKRIFEARKEKGLTLKELGELTGGLKQTRLTNWEQGTRAPGPEEIKLLAQALDVSPAFLMCLSDDQQVKRTKSYSHLIPLLDHHQACDAKSFIEAISDQGSAGDVVWISVSATLIQELSSEAFALKMPDESMMPELRLNDVLVVEPSVTPCPGDFVVVKLANKLEAIVCQYRETTYTEFELVTLNDNWPNIKNTKEFRIEIIGKIIENMRLY